MRFLVVCLALAAVAAGDHHTQRRRTQGFPLRQPWSYSCEQSSCRKLESAKAETYQSLERCQLTCGRSGAIWPEPTGQVEMVDNTVSFRPINMQVSTIEAPNEQVETMLVQAFNRFKRNLYFLHPDHPEVEKRMVEDDQEQQQFQQHNQQLTQQQLINRFRSNLPETQPEAVSAGQAEEQFEFMRQARQQEERRQRYFEKSPFSRQRTSAMVERQRVHVAFSVANPDNKINIDTEEQYTLAVKQNGAPNAKPEDIVVEITAPTYFGARHALETLSQLIAYDDINNAVQIVETATVEDMPAYRYRGLMLDTARQFYPKEDLMKLMDSMSYNKLNRFHWHITDAAAFPLYSVRRPEMAYYGSYAPNKVYYPEDIAEIVEYANLRGIAVVPELSAPGRVSNGWQWGEKEGKGKLVICNEGERWYEFGKEPPSGQINLANPEVMPILADLYTDIMENFEPDMFHMGGDLVSFKCFANSPEIVEYLASQEKEAKSPAFFELWNTFQSNALNQLQVAAGERAVTPIISASMGQRNIPVEQYIVHVQSKPEEVAAFLNAGYKVIVSDQQQWSLDCVTDEWIGEKAVECPVQAPTWETFYNYSPVDQAITNGVTKARADLARDQVLGGEATLESYQTGAKGAERKVWPRVSALAERLWTDPLPEQSEHSIGETMRRINIFRQRMVQLGVQADPIQPEYCLQDQLTCLSQQQQVARSEHPDFTRAEAPAPVQA